MPERSFWDRLFDDRYNAEREEKVVQYIIHRLKEGDSLYGVVQEEYVRRNTSPRELEEICSSPELVEAARGHMEEDFSSGELDPRRRPR